MFKRAQEGNLREVFRREPTCRSQKCLVVPTPKRVPFSKAEFAISACVPCIDNKTTLEKVEQAQIYLPHLVFAGLAENYPSFFEDSMSLKHLEKFWLQVEKSGDDKRSKNIPLFLRGDGVEFQTRDSLLTFSFGAGLGKPLPGSIPQKLYP